MDANIKTLVLTRSRKHKVLWIGDARVTVEAKSNVRIIVQAPAETRIVREEARAA